MVPAHLHALRRDGPNLGGQIELVLVRADRLASARRGENHEFERARRGPVLFPQLRHELPELGVWECGMMLYRADLVARRQQIFQMSPPARRVIASSQTSRSRPIED